MIIRELTIERSYSRACDQVRGYNPRQIVEIAKMPTNSRQRSSNDSLVKRAKEHCQHDAKHNGPDFRVGQCARLWGRLGLHRACLGHKPDGGHRVRSRKTQGQQPAQCPASCGKARMPARECYVREIARRTALPTCNRGAWPGDSRIGGKTVSYKSGWLGLMTSA